jgi:hypothetical protein
MQKRGFVVLRLFEEKYNIVLLYAVHHMYYIAVVLTSSRSMIIILVDLLCCQTIANQAYQYILYNA